MKSIPEELEARTVERNDKESQEQAEREKEVAAAIRMLQARLKEEGWQPGSVEIRAELVAFSRKGFVHLLVNPVGYKWQPDPMEWKVSEGAKVVVRVLLDPPITSVSFKGLMKQLLAPTRWRKDSQ